MSNSVTPTDPFPADGYRTLSPREVAHRAASFICMHNKGPGVSQGRLYSTLSFDGTGNNPKWTEPNTSGTQQVPGKHSNIARLFNAALSKPADGFFPDYIPGVGTPFEETTPGAIA